MNQEQLQLCIANFVTILNVSFNSIKQAYDLHKMVAEKNGLLVSFSEYFDDWAQTNWELLVERVICSSKEYLTIYASGSDYEADSHSRVFFQKALPTHNIICQTRQKVIDWISKEEVDLTKYDFEEFVAVSGDWFDISTPFNHVLLTEKGVVGGNYQQVVIPLDQVYFEIQAIEI